MLLFLISGGCQCQKLILEDVHSKKNIKVKKGHSISIVTGADTLDTYLLYSGNDSIRSNERTQGGHWKLHNINSKAKTITMINVLNNNGEKRNNEEKRVFEIDKIDYVICSREEASNYKLGLLILSVGALIGTKDFNQTGDIIAISFAVGSVVYIVLARNSFKERTFRIVGIKD